MVRSTRPGRGEMTSAMGHVKGSGAYVAVEYVNGTLDGKAGAFVLHHVGVMDRGEQSLVIKSGTRLRNGWPRRDLGHDDHPDRGRETFLRLRLRDRHGEVMGGTETTTRE